MTLTTDTRLGTWFADLDLDVQISSVRKHGRLYIREVVGFFECAFGSAVGPE